MSDILSQNQIDDLLNALSAGEVDVNAVDKDELEKKVKKYDFRRPDKFAKEQLRTIEIIHENFARLINNYLNGYLRAMVDVQVISTESLVYSEFSNSISNPSILCIMNFEPLEGQIIIDLGVSLGYAMIEKLLGGKVSKQGAEAKALTEIEETLIRIIFGKFIDQIKEAWSKIIELSPSINSIETNAQFAQLLSPSESIALITFEMKVDSIDGLFNIAIPYFVLEPIIASLSSKKLFGNKYEELAKPEDKEALQKNIGTTTLPIKAIVGQSSMSVYELLSLEKGDVLVLDTKVDSDMEVYVSDKLKFRGIPGLSKKNVAVKLTKVLEEGDDKIG